MRFLEKLTMYGANVTIFNSHLKQILILEELMLSYQTYKLLHYLGFMLLFFGIGGVFIPAMAGIKIQGKPRIAAFISHGLGMLFLIVAGFGMLARLQIDGIPGWIHVKLAVWLVLGLAIGIARRMPSWLILIFIFLVALIAPYFAIYKTIS